MARSGVKIPEKVVEEFKRLQTGHEIEFMILKISKDLKEVEIVYEKEKSEERKSSKSHDLKDDEHNYEHFLEWLKEENEKGGDHFHYKNTCCWAIIDTVYHEKDALRNKVLYIKWAPEEASVKEKMLLSSSDDALKSKTSEVQVRLQCNDDDDLQYSNIEKELCKK